MARKTKTKPKKIEFSAATAGQIEKFTITELLEDPVSANVKIEDTIVNIIKNQQMVMENDVLMHQRISAKKKKNSEDEDDLARCDPNYLGNANPWSEKWEVNFDGSTFFGQYKEDSEGVKIQEGLGVKVDSLGYFLTGYFTENLLISGQVINKEGTLINGIFHTLPLKGAENDDEDDDESEQDFIEQNYDAWGEKGNECYIQEGKDWNRTIYAEKIVNFKGSGKGSIFGTSYGTTRGGVRLGSRGQDKGFRAENI